MVRIGYLIYVYNLFTIKSYCVRKVSINLLLLIKRTAQNLNEIKNANS